MIFEENMFLFKSEQAQTYYEDYKVMLSIESGEIGNIINLAEMETDHGRYKPLDTGEFEFDEIRQDADQINQYSEDGISCADEQLNNGLTDCDVESYIFLLNFSFFLNFS